MTKLRALLAGVVIAAFAFTSAFAQVQTQIDGNTLLRGSEGSGGTGYDYALDSVRNGTQFQTTTQTSAATSTATGGTLMWIGTAPTTWAVTLPALGVAFPGEEVVLVTDTTLTTMVSVTAGTGNTLHATYTSQTLTALTPVVFQYQSSTKTWFRTQ